MICIHLPKHTLAFLHTDIPCIYDRLFFFLDTFLILLYRHHYIFWDFVFFFDMYLFYFRSSLHYLEFDIPYSVLTLNYITYFWTRYINDIKFDFVLLDFLLNIKLNFVNKILRRYVSQSNSWAVKIQDCFISTLDVSPVPGILNRSELRHATGKVVMLCHGSWWRQVNCAKRLQSLHSSLPSHGSWAEVSWTGEPSQPRPPRSSNQSVAIL